MNARVLALIVALAVVVGVTWLVMGRMRAALPMQSSPSKEGRVESSTSVVLEGDEPETGREPASSVTREQPGVAREMKANVPPHALLRVEVFALETGAPIVGVSLSVEGGSRSAASDVEGRAKFFVKPEQPLVLMAQVWGVDAGSREVKVEPLSVGEERTLRVPLSTRFDLHWFARVVEAETKLPIAGAEVDVFLLNGLAASKDQNDETMRRSVRASISAFAGGQTLDRRPLIARGMTDGDGRIALDIPSWAVDVARVRAPGRFWTAVPAEENVTTIDEPLTIELVRTAALDARVLETDGKPAEGVEVRLRIDGLDLADGLALPDSVWTATTDATGSCSFDGLAAGLPIGVELARAGRILQRPQEHGTSEARLMLNPGERSARDWQLEGGCALSGVALDANGQALESLSLVLAEYPLSEVNLEGEGWAAFEDYRMKPFATSPTDAKGRFAFERIPAGDWAIAPDRMVAELPRVAWFFRIDPRQASKEFELRFQRELEIGGTVLGPDGGPEAGCELVARGIEGVGQELSVGAQSKSDGTFVLGPLVPGRYTIYASEDQELVAPAEPLDVSAGQTNVVLQLSWGGVLRGEVKDERGDLVRAHMELRSNGEEVDRSDGASFEFRGRHPGRYELIAKTDDGRVGVLQDLAVQPKGRLDGLVLTVGRGCDVLLRVSDRETNGRWYEATWNGTLVDEGWLEPGKEIGVFMPPGPIVVSWCNFDDQDKRVLEHEDQRVIASPDDKLVIEYEARR